MIRSGDTEKRGIRRAFQTDLANKMRLVDCIGQHLVRAIPVPSKLRIVGKANDNAATHFLSRHSS